MTPTLGIIGGMGPEATYDLAQKITKSNKTTKKFFTKKTPFVKEKKDCKRDSYYESKKT